MASSKRLIRFLVKFLLIFFVCVIAAAFLLLKAMERSPAQLKVGFESYLTQISGYPADIGVLRKVSFVPDMMVDMEDVRLWALDDPSRTMIGVRRATVRMPLWSVMIGAPRFADLSIEGVAVDEDATGIAPLALESLAIDKVESRLAARGAIGDIDIEGAVPLERAGARFKPQPPPLRLVFSVAGAHTQGDIFVDINRGSYGATADFPRYDAREMRPALQLLAVLFDKRGVVDGTLPIRLNIGRLEGRSGPFEVPALTIVDGALQPPECFYNNRSRADATPHPCTRYFDEPDADVTP